jgi:hypothetical protein
MELTLRPSFPRVLGCALIACAGALGCAPDLTLKHQSIGGGGAGPEGGKYLDAKRFGDAGDQTAAGVAVGSDGSVTWAGNFAGSVDFGKGPLMSAGGDDIFVARSDTQGNLTFTARLGDASRQACRALAVDPMGNTFLAGDFTGSIDWGGTTQSSAGGQDGYVAKLDSTGAVRWLKAIGDLGEQAVTSVAVDAAGNVVIAGFFSGAVSFGGAPLASAGGYDIFVAKLDPEGGILWNKRFGDEADQRAFGVAADSAGNTFLVGTFAGAIDLGGDVPLKSAGEANALVVKLGPDGGTLWSKRFGDTTAAASSSVAVDDDDGVIVAGTFAGSIDLGGGALESEQDGGLFVAKLDGGGEHVWSRGLGKTGAASVRSVATDGSGGVLLTGEFAGGMAIGETLLASAGVEDGFVARLDARGKVAWSERFGDAAAQRGTGVAVGEGEDVWLVGGFAGNVDFGGGALMSAGGADVFLARLTR